MLITIIQQAITADNPVHISKINVNQLAIWNYSFSKNIYYIQTYQKGTAKSSPFFTINYSHLSAVALVIVTDVPSAFVRVRVSSLSSYA